MSETSAEIFELADAFVLASRAIVGLAIRSLAASPVELTLPQHRALVLLAMKKAATINDLADGLDVNQSNASRICDRLERLDLVARQRSETDRRATDVQLTPTGRTVLDMVDARRHAEVTQILERVGDTDAVAAIRALNAFAAAAAERQWVDAAASEEPDPSTCGE